MSKHVYFLTGFMASGKSTVGPILANTLGWNFYDLDEEIVKREGIKITEIFSEKGENYFRKSETEVLNEISKGERIIISLGGGTLLINENRKIIKSRGKLVYLKSSPETAYNRLRFKRDRPVLLFDGEDEPTKEEYIARIENLLEDRKQFYEEADIILNTDNERVGRTVDKLAKIIESNIKKSD